jgi:hypothetical protein
MTKHSNNEKEASAKDGGEFIKFQIGDATVYSRVHKQLLIDAKAISPYGMDIATMLQEDTEVDFTADRPTKEVIVESDKDMKRIMEEQAKTEYEAMAKEWVARRSHYRQNQSVMCGLIAKRCENDLTDRLETRPGYKEWSMRKPLVFLRMIKEECIAFKDNEYPCSTQHKVFKDLYNILQGPEESVSDYAKRVRVHWELLLLSTTISYNRINPKLHEGYTSKTIVERAVLNIRTDERFIAYVMVVGADKRRFGQLIERLEDAYDVGTDNYPHTIDDAKNYLDRTAEKKSHGDDGDRTAEKKSHGDDGDVKSVGAVPQCQNQIKDDELELSFATIRMCHVCGKKGHLAPKCSLRRKIPEEDWYIARVKKQQAPKTENIYTQATAFYDL